MENCSRVLKTSELYVNRYNHFRTTFHKYKLTEKGIFVK